MLEIRHPDTHVPERAYAIGVVLGTFLGQPFTLRAERRDDVLLTVPGEDGSVAVADVLFARAGASLVSPDSLPALPLAEVDAASLPGAPALCGPRLPVLFGTGEAATDGRDLRLGLDVFGSAFFALTRLEELVEPDARDEHGRFPASASVLHRAGVVERPLVDEYAEVLWSCLTSVWRLDRPARAFRLRPSHDVDWLHLSSSAAASFRAAAGDLLRRRDAVTAARRVAAWAATASGRGDADVAQTLDLLMDCSERAGVASAFYFLPGADAGGPGGADYELAEPAVVRLLARIAARGHEIGLHGGYDTYRDPGRLVVERDRLRAACRAAGVERDSFGGRHHYLRWRNPITWRAWAEAGMAYDSTLGFVEAPGFRAGTCREYPVFDVERRRPLALTERPLVVMDGSLLDDRYLGLSHDEAVETVGRLARACRRMHGELTLLWHNTMLIRGRDRRLYERLLAL